MSMDLTAKPTGSTMYAPKWAHDRAKDMVRDGGLTWDDFRGRGRSDREVSIRTAIAYVLRTTKGPYGIGLSFPEVAYAVGKSGHASIIDQYNRAVRSRETPPDRRGHREKWIVLLIEKWEAVYGERGNQ